MKIYKYTVKLQGYTKLMLETGYEDPVFAQSRHDSDISLWFIWDNPDMDEDDKTPTYFRVFATGEHIPESHTYKATVRDGLFIWHVFEVPEDDVPENDR